MNEPFSISESPSGGARQKDDADVAVYEGAFNEYEFYAPSGMEGYVVVTHKTRGGSDLLPKSVQKLVFADCEKSFREVVPTRPWSEDEIKKPGSNLNSQDEKSDEADAISNLNIAQSVSNLNSNLNIAQSVSNLNSNLNIAPQNNPNFKPADNSNLNSEIKEQISFARISNLNEIEEPKKPDFEIIEEEPFVPEEKDFEGDFLIIEEESADNSNLNIANLKGGALESSAANLAVSNLKSDHDEPQNPSEYFGDENNPLKNFVLDPARKAEGEGASENLALEFGAEEGDKSQTPVEAYNFGRGIAAPSVPVRDVKVYIASFDETSDGFYFSHFPEGARYKYSISQNEFFAHFIMPGSVSNLSAAQTPQNAALVDFLRSLTFRTARHAPKKFIVLINDVPYFYDAI